VAGRTDPSGQHQSRGFLEHNSIALLTTAAGGVDEASQAWLGRHAVNLSIARSGLSSVNNVDEQYNRGS
jgi:hypothetical protein